MPFNGPGRELPPSEAFDAERAKVYCPDCGTIYVWARGRDCPACALAEMIESVGDRVEMLARERRGQIKQELDELQAAVEEGDR